MLGPITIGDGAKIGSGSVVVKSVPPEATVVGVPGTVVQDRHKPAVDLEHGKLPDPVAEAIRLILEEQGKLEERLRRIEAASGLTLAATADELQERRLKIEEMFHEGGGI